MFIDPIARRLAADSHTRLQRELSALRRRAKGEGRILRSELDEATLKAPSEGVVGWYECSDGTTDLNPGSPTAYPWNVERRQVSGISLSAGRFTFLQGGDWLLLVHAALQSAGSTFFNLQPLLNGATYIPPRAYGSFLADSRRSFVLVGFVEAAPGAYMEIVCRGSPPFYNVVNIPTESSLILQRV